MDSQKEGCESGSCSEFMRSVRYRRPAHFELKIQSYSLLASSGLHKYESGVFEAGGYNWRLAFYPLGKNKKSSQISLDLVIAETDDLLLGWEINVLFKLFIKDQTRDKYLVVQADDNGRRFYATQTEGGFEEFLPMDTLKDASKGYLVDDCCIFGAEVFVVQHCSDKLECLAMVKDPPNKTFTWKIQNYSGLGSVVKSEPFTVGETNWKLVIYPKSGQHLSIYICLDDFESLPPNRKVFAEYKLRIKSQLTDDHVEDTASRWFDSPMAWGFRKFILLSKLKDPFQGYTWNNNLIAEAEIEVVSVIKEF